MTDKQKEFILYKWTKEQKEELLKIADLCEEVDSLAPLYAAIYIANPVGDKGGK